MENLFLTGRPESFMFAARMCFANTGETAKPRKKRLSMGTSARVTWPRALADGYYTLQGRRCDLIISGGFNIYPREIEDFLTEQPEVAEAAVIGTPDRLRGEVPVAYLVARSAVDPAQWNSVVAKAWRLSKFPERFTLSRTCRVTLWARFKNISFPELVPEKVWE